MSLFNIVIKQDIGVRICRRRGIWSALLIVSRTREES